MNSHEAEIKKMLELLQSCYTERDEMNIEELSDALFSQELPPIILGTGSSELCFGISKCNEIFLSDWKNWGDFSIDMSSLVMRQSGEISSLVVKGRLAQAFKDSDQRYASYMDLVSKMASSGKNSIEKAGDIIWALSHLLHSRDSGERHYDWDVTLSGIAHTVNGVPKIKIMQFSMPFNIAYPDVNLNTSEAYEAEFYAKGKEMITSAEDGREKLSALLNKTLAAMPEIRLAQDFDGIFIGFDGLDRNAFEFMRYLAGNNDAYALIKLSEVETIAFQIGQHFSFCGIGLYNREIYGEDEFSRILCNIENYKESGDIKNALFRLRRDLAYVLKETSGSSTSVAPIRIEGTGMLDDDGVIFDYLQISYPFDWILEQKTDFTS